MTAGVIALRRSWGLEVRLRFASMSSVIESISWRVIKYAVLRLLSTWSLGYARGVGVPVCSASSGERMSVIVVTPDTSLSPLALRSVMVFGVFKVVGILRDVNLSRTVWITWMLLSIDPRVYDELR
jgi:hypothetical protein